MKVDQAMITGESEPVDSSVVAADPNALEARNIIFSGSLVVDGACLAVVIRTGTTTVVVDWISSNPSLYCDHNYIIR